MGTRWLSASLGKFLSVPSLAAYPGMLERDRRRRGFMVGQVASRLGVKPQEYWELEAGSRSLDFETWDRICKLYGWPQTFVGSCRE